MKNLNINQVLKDFKGRAVAFQENEEMTIKDVLLQQLGGFPGDGNQMIKAYQLGMKINSHKKDPFKIEDAEFSLLKKSLEKAFFATIVMAPVLMEINRVDKEKQS